jgi:hypothetical protein
MGDANLITTLPIQKTLYPQKDIEVEWHEHMPLYAQMDKLESFSGKNLQIALRYGTTQGRSRQFANAQANKTASKLANWLITRCRDYSIYAIDGETIDATGDDAGAIVEAVTIEIDAAMDAIKLSTARSMYRNSGGALARVGSGSTTATITLSDVNTVIFFEVGQIVTTYATDGSTPGVGPNAGTAALTAVDRQVGTITAGATFISTIPAIATSDYIFTDGDYGASCAGLDGWIPSTAPTSGDSFFGLDRSVDPVRLAGVRAQNTAGLAPEEALQTGLQQIFRQGGRPTCIFENDADFKLLVLSLGSRVIYETVKTDAEIGFEGVKIVGMGIGSVLVFPDPNCQQGTAWALDMRSWTFNSLKAFPRFLDLDKLGRLVREATADAYEGRIGGYYQMYCDAPAWNGRIPL